MNVARTNACLGVLDDRRRIGHDPELVISVNRRLIACLVGALFLLPLTAFFAFYEQSAPAPKAASKPPVVAEPAPASESSPAAFVHPVPALDAAPSAAASPLPAPPLAALDEASLMAKLRELHGSNPELTLKLSRDAQQRFKNSPDAAEQSWFVVKSLTDLGRHDEARVEGRKLVKGYPGTRWAEDAHRHLFVNPATHPAERGYGKDFDLD